MKESNIIKSISIIGTWLSKLRKAEMQFDVTSLEDILNIINANDSLKESMDAACSYLALDAEHTFMFIVLLALKSRGNDRIDIDDIASFISLSAIEVLSHQEPLKDLIDNGLVENKYQFLGMNHCELKVCPNVFNAVLSSQPITSDMLSSNVSSNEIKDPISFVKVVADMVEDREGKEISTWEMTSIVENLESNYKETIPFTKDLKSIIDTPFNRVFFYDACSDFITSYRHRSNLKKTLDDMTGDSVKKYNFIQQFKEGNHILVRSKLLQLCPQTISDDDDIEVELTEEGKELFLGENADLYQHKQNDRNLIHCKDLKEKRLFYPEDFSKDINQLTEILKEDNLKGLQKRLEDKNLPKGIAILLYGAPGTGKTETVYQIARQTGRDIMHIDISSTKSCWFGESEKLTKEIFTHYRNCCKRSKIAPILLFNEADAVFSKRKDSNAGNCAQTENAIQNILLEEMENMNGILIATTNMADNLDAAFDRRFLFKLRYEKPNTEAKRRIWMDKIQSLDDRLAEELATRYDFSGGEIDNIVRKVTIEEVLSGSAVERSSLIHYCDSERIALSKQSQRIGF